MWDDGKLEHFSCVCVKSNRFKLHVFSYRFNRNSVLIKWLLLYGNRSQIKVYLQIATNWIILTTIQITAIISEWMYTEMASRMPFIRFQIRFMFSLKGTFATMSISRWLIQFLMCKWVGNAITSKKFETMSFFLCSCTKTHPNQFALILVYATNAFWAEFCSFL